MSARLVYLSTSVVCECVVLKSPYFNFKDPTTCQNIHISYTISFILWNKKCVHDTFGQAMDNEGVHMLTPHSTLGIQQYSCTTNVQLYRLDRDRVTYPSVECSERLHDVFGWLIQRRSEFLMVNADESYKWNIVPPYCSWYDRLILPTKYNSAVAFSTKEVALEANLNIMFFFVENNNQ